MIFYGSAYSKYNHPVLQYHVVYYSLNSKFGQASELYWVLWGPIDSPVGNNAVNSTGTYASFSQQNKMVQIFHFHKSQKPFLSLFTSQTALHLDKPDKPHSEQSPKSQPSFSEMKKNQGKGKSS